MRAKLSISLSDDIADRLVAEAAEKGLSVSRLVQMVLSEHFRDGGLADEVHRLNEQVEALRVALARAPAVVPAKPEIRDAKPMADDVASLIAEFTGGEE